MTQHYIFHERFDTPTGYAWRVGTVCLTEAEANHVGKWLAQRKAYEAFEPVTPPSADPVGNAMPPNCDGFAHSGQEPTQAGQVLAHAQHEAAISGAECNGTACLMTRGSD